MSYLPYVYYLVFTHPETGEKLYYIGSEYAEITKTANPENLFTIYDTSSPKVKELIEEFGKECFVISIRKTFKTGDEAVNYEHRLLKRLGAKARPDFINESNGGLGQYGPLSEKSKEKYNNSYRKTCLERYDVENIAQSDIVKNKTKQTCLDKYNVEYITQSNTFKNAAKSALLERYGVEHPLQSDVIKEKFKHTSFKKYGVEHPMQNSDVIDKFRKKISINNIIYQSASEAAITLNVSNATIITRWVKTKKHNANYIEKERQ
jgi:hypothetical protein